MPNIDTLTIQFGSKGTETAVKNIKSMASAVRVLSGSLRMMDMSKFGEFSSGMDTLKKSVPTSSQTNRMVDFADAVSKLSAAIGASNISGFSNDMSNLGTAVQMFKKSSVNSITNAVAAMETLGHQAERTANTISKATPKSSKNVSANSKPVDIGSISQVISSLDKVQVKASGVKGILQKMGMVVPTKAFKTLEENAEKVRRKYDEVRQTLQKGLEAGKITSDSSEYAKKMAELDGLRNKYDELILKQRQLSREGGAFRLSPALTKSIEVLKSGFSKVANLVRSGVLSAFKSINAHVKSFSNRIKDAGKALKSTITSGNSATKVAKKFANEIFRVSKMLKLMITRMALRKVIAEVGDGFKSLAIHSDTFNNSVSSMMNGAKQLGYSFAAMVSPLINALAPAIVYLINLFTKLANIINQVLSALTGGTTWNKAKAFTSSWRDSFEDTADAASDTAKEIKKTVMGFDELNQLTDNSQKSSSNKNKDGGIGDMFDTVPIDQKWKDIADWLKKMWELGDFYDLGKLLGEKLRDMLESIPWDKIRETANKLGKSLATLINGFVEVERLGYDIGYTIAQSVNTVFEFLNGFVRNLHWASIGKFIADTFNGFFENIDWDLIKDTVITGMRGIAQAIWQFIQEFHWDNISDFIKNGLDTIAKGIRAFFETPGYDDRGFKLNDSWAKRLGKEIGHQLSEVFEDKELWHEVGQALGDLVQGAIDFLAGFVSELDVKDVVDSLTEMVNGFFEQVNSEEAGKTLGELLQKLYDIIKGFWLGNKDTLYNEVKEFFGGFFSEVDVEQMAADAIAILSWAVNGLLTFWDEHGEQILTAVKNFFTGLWDKIDKEQLKSTLKEIIHAVAKYAIPAGLALVGVKLVSSAISGIFTRLTIKKAIESALSGVLGEAMGGAVTEAAGSETVIGAAEAAGASLGSIIITAIASVLAGNLVIEGGQSIFSWAITKGMESGGYSESEIEAVKEDLQFLEDRYEGLGGKVQLFKDAFNMDGLVLPSEVKQSYEDLGTAVDNAKVPVVEMTDDFKNAQSVLTETSNSYKEYANEIAAATKESKSAASEVKNTASAIGKNNEEVSKLVKTTDEGTKSTSKWVEEHRKSNQAWNDLKNSVEKANETTDKSKTSIENLTTTAGKYTEALPKLTNEQQSFIDSLKNMSTSGDEVAKNLNTSIESIYQDSKTVTETIPSEVANANTEILGIEKELTKTTDDSMKDIKKSVEDNMKEVDETFETIKKGMTKEQWTFQGVADGLGETFRRAKEAIKREWNSIADTLNGEHEVASETIKIDLPKFARGGFPEDGLFYANHNELVGSFNNGRTAVANNTQIIEGISSGVYGAVSKAMAQNNSNGKYISNTIVVDGEVIARTVTKAQDRQNMRYSPTMA